MKLKVFKGVEKEPKVTLKIKSNLICDLKPPFGAGTNAQITIWRNYADHY